MRRRLDNESAALDYNGIVVSRAAAPSIISGNVLGEELRTFGEE